MPVSKPRKRKPARPRAITRQQAATSRAASAARAETLARIASGVRADPRAMERHTTRATRELLEREGITVVEEPSDPALDRAQDLVYDAWETEGQARVELAVRALEISPDCADAYVILAEAAPTLGQALEAYALGMRAGERALRPRAFEEDAGHFWGILETRPYMRARAGLAACLWQLGEREAALVHYRELLRLNPNDNQGIRYQLLDSFLSLGLDDEAETMLERSEYADDASCEWSYGRALLLFRREGDSETARRALGEARESNRHVIPYLTGHKPLPEELPDLIEIGGETEAIAYVATRADAWRETAGAVEWLQASQPEHY